MSDITTQSLTSLVNNIKNKKLSSEYSYRALDFLSKHKPTSTKAQRTQYLFADQRLLSMIAEAGDYNFGTLVIVSLM